MVKERNKFEVVGDHNQKEGDSKNIVESFLKSHPSRLTCTFSWIFAFVFFYLNIPEGSRIKQNYKAENKSDFFKKEQNALHKILFSLQPDIRILMLSIVNLECLILISNVGTLTIEGIINSIRYQPIPSFIFRKLSFQNKSELNSQ